MKKIFYIFLYTLCLFNFAFSNEILNENESEENRLYTLSVDGNTKDYVFPVYFKNGIHYLSLDDFLEDINFKNFEKGKNNSWITLKLGESLEEVKFDFKNNQLKFHDKSTDIKDKFLLQDEKIYIDESIFKYCFTQKFCFDESKNTLKIFLSFLSPENIKEILALNESQLESTPIEKIYKNTHPLLDLGYLRVTFNKEFSKNESQKKFKGNWNGQLEYQGPILYGDFITTYDVKNRKLLDTSLKYEDLIKNHTLEVDSSPVGKNNREWRFIVHKDKGYYQAGKNFYIHESVPIGSKGELIFMGTVVEIETATNGELIFNSPEIKGNKTYILKIYKPDGTIEQKTITTTEDYNLQNKNEVEYNVLAKKDPITKKLYIDSSVYYGFTDALTLSFGYTKEIVNAKNKSTNIDLLKFEGIYGSNFKSLTYTTRLFTEQTITDLQTDNKNYKDQDKYGFLGEVNFSKIKLTTEYNTYGAFYNNKKDIRNKISLEATDNLQINYECKENFYRKSKEISRLSEILYNMSYKKLLTTIDLKKDFDKDMADEYSIRNYYSGFNNYTIKLENNWTNSGKDYEVSLGIYNNANSFITYSFEAAYSEKTKDKFTLSFSMDYDNWLTFSGNGDKKGNQSYTAGIDKIIDLKNPLTDIKNIDSSRVKIVTFLDKNNNDKYDLGETLLPDIDVILGEKTITTNSKGEAFFYGVSNGIKHSLALKMKTPAYSLSNNKYYILGKGASTIDAYIPIKPLTTLSGTVILDSILGLSKDEKENILSNVLVTVKDLNGKTIENAIPDDNGEFDVSGLFPCEYYLELEYLGEDLNIKKSIEKVQIDYIATNPDCNKWILTLNKDLVTFQRDLNQMAINK